VGGAFYRIGGSTIGKLAAINMSTGLVTAFNPNAGGGINSLALDGTTLYVGGIFTSIGGAIRNRIAGINTSNGLATAFNPNADNTVYAISISGTNIYLGGDFLNIGGQPRDRIAAFDLSTGLIKSFDPEPAEARSIHFLQVERFYTPVELILPWEERTEQELQPLISRLD